MSLTTVLYHAVRAPGPRPPWDGFSRWNPTEDEFRRQVRLLRRRYNPVSIDQVIAWQRGGEPLPPRALLITFDDGYLSNLTQCAPVLADYGFSALCFVLSGVLERSRMPWFVPFDRAMRRATGRPFAWRGAEWDVRTLTGLTSFVRAFKDHLYAQPATDHLSVVAELAGSLGVSAAGTDELFAWDADDEMQFMSVADLSRWTGAGMALGAHTHSHADLSSVPSTELREEVLGSRERLARLGVHVKAFAYPDGRFRDEAASLVEAHFEVGFGVRVEPGRERRGALPRRAIGSDSPRALWREMTDPPALALRAEDLADRVLMRLGVRVPGWR